MKEYTKQQLENLYDNEPQELANMFLKAGYNAEYVINMLNKSSKEIIVLRAYKISIALQKENINDSSQEKYQIPIKYNVPEIPEFKEDRDIIYQEMNNKINKEIGEALEQIYSYDEEDYVTAIHRTSLPYEDIISKIFTQGICYDRDTNPYYADHAQVFNNFPFMLRELKYCEDYKMSQGAVILKIPKKYIGKDETDTPLPLYYKGKDGKTYLRPEFICAYVSVRNQKLCDYVI